MSDQRNANKVRLGIIGLGRGFMLTLPSLLAHADITLFAACSTRSDASVIESAPRIFIDTALITPGDKVKPCIVVVRGNID